MEVFKNHKPGNKYVAARLNNHVSLGFCFLWVTYKSSILVCTHCEVLAGGELLDVRPSPEPGGHRYGMRQLRVADVRHDDKILKVAFVSLIVDGESYGQNFANWLADGA